MVRLDRITMQGFKSFAGKVMIPFPDGFNVIAGPNGSGKCLHYDSLVTLSDGGIVKIGKLVESRLEKSKKVSEIEDGFIGEGDETKILTLDKNLKISSHPIKAFIKRKSPDKLLHIKTRSGREVIATPYHPFFGINENGIFSLKAEEIKIGKRIAVPRIIPIFEKSVFSSSQRNFENLYVPYSDELKTAIKVEIKKRHLTYREFAKESGIPHAAIKGLFDGRSIRHDYLKKLSDKYRLKLDIDNVKSKNQNKAIKIPSISSEMARFLGYMISEGRSTDSNQLWFVNDDEELISDFVEICKNHLGVEANVFSYKGDTKDVILFSKPLQIVLEESFDLKIGSNSSEKVVPELIFRCDGDIIKNFLSALFEGDGYFNLGSGQTYFEYSTASKELAEGIQQLLLRLGILSVIKEKIKYASNTKRKIKRKYHSIYVYGESLKILIENIELKGRKKETADKIKRLEFVRNSNIDTIPDINAIIKSLVRECKISIKKTRSECPKLAAYYEDRCACSRNGIREIVEVIKKYGSITPRASALMNQLLLIADSDILWDEIIEIKETKPSEWVYDLTVDETHNYIANGFFVHNSNVIDAITFVLGTTSARSIRAEKLQNLLFNGARDRKPADFCEVSLYLDNSDDKIPGEKEMKVSRKITRSGISVYKINGRNTTRAKVLDILSYANLFTEGYNIIMQGDVTKIIEMSAQERRSILDEISGISEFDEKKQKASIELEKVESRVKENMIVVAEKQRLVERLKQEKEVAEKYIMLSDELKKSKASLVRKKLSDAEEKYSLIDTEIKSGEESFGVLESEFESVEKELEKKEKNVFRKSDELIKKSRNYDIQRKIDGMQTEIIRKNDRIDLIDRELERLRELSAGRQNPAVKEVLKLGHPGIRGTLMSLLSVPKRYEIAIQVAVGRHADDIVVDDDDVASECVRMLKEKRIGRARFLPLNKIRGGKRKDVRGDYIGWASDLVKFNKDCLPAVDYVLGSTVITDSLDKARRLGRLRAATLDGDLIEASGAIIGGFYRKKAGDQYSGHVAKAEEEKGALEAEVSGLESKLEELKGQEQEETKEVTKLQEEKSAEEKEIDGMRKKRKELYEQRLVQQSRVSKLRIEKARLEASLDNFRIEFGEYRDVQEFYDKSVDELQEKLRFCVIEINRLGPINMRAIEEYGTIGVEFDEMKRKLEKLLEEKDAILRIVHEVEKRRYDKFMEVMVKIRENFAKIYEDLTGGIGILRLEEENNIDTGLVIEASPMGKRVVNLDAMSGGEKTLTSLAFLFAIMQYSSAPFYVLDEIDAALDKANTKKIAGLIKKYSAQVQFIVISHNDITIQEADKVFGVSIEGGVSKVFGIDMTRAG